MSDITGVETNVGLRRISWGAIIAGVILTLVVEVMLGLLGVGIGLASLDPAGQGGAGGGTLLSVGGIFTALAVLVATFCGAYAAARFAGLSVKRDAALHGITTWAVSTLVAVYLLSTGASALVSTTFGALGGTIQSLGSAASSAIPDQFSLEALPDGLQAEAEQLLQQGQQQAGAAVDQAQQAAQGAAADARQATGNQDLGAAVGEIFAGLQDDATSEQRQAAVSVIASQAGIPEPEAEQRLTQFQTRYDEAVAQARETAATAADAASGAAFGAFVMLLLGAIVAAFGGMAGRPPRFGNLYRD